MRILWTHILVYMFRSLKKEPIDAILCLRHGAGRFDIGRSARLEPGGFIWFYQVVGLPRRARSEATIIIIFLYSNSFFFPFPLLIAYHTVGYRDGAGGC